MYQVHPTDSCLTIVPITAKNALDIVGELKNLEGYLFAVLAMYENSQIDVLSRLWVYLFHVGDLCV